MLITDNDVINLFYTKGGSINPNVTKHYNNIDEYTNIDVYEYLKNRYSDSSSLLETVYRIKNNIDIRPICKECGGYVAFNNGHFCEFCSLSCSNKNKDKKIKSKKTCLLKYNDENYNNRLKYKQTCLERYGVEYYTNYSKCKQTKLLRYGNEFYSNIEKAKNTVLEKYGVENISMLDYIKQKKEQTCLQNYGVKYGWHTEYGKQKAYDGILNYFASDHYKLIRESYIKRFGCLVNIDKIKNTRYNLYGVDNFFCIPSIQQIAEKNAHSEQANQKRIATCINKYSNDTYWGSELNKITMSEIMSSDWMQNKINNTKRINKTFSSSSQEDKTYELLKEKFNYVYRNYKSEEYPYLCDFYIKDINLYIECNYHWTHGKHLFDENNLNDLLILENWKSKNTKYYNNAIKTWAIRDVKKYKKFISNNLNFKIFYSFTNFLDWYSEFKT